VGKRGGSWEPVWRPWSSVQSEEGGGPWNNTSQAVVKVRGCGLREFIVGGFHVKEGKPPKSPNIRDKRSINKGDFFSKKKQGVR